MFLRRAFALSLFLVLTSAFFSNLFASEFTNGNIRLILHERTGSFSLYYLSNPQTMRYEPLFNSSNPANSYASISVDGNIFRLGDRNVRPRYERFNRNPSFIFELPNMLVRQVFTPYKTPNSGVINGIMLTFIIQNTGNQSSMVGLKMLLDTELGEGRGRIPFITSSQIVTNEYQVEAEMGERFWISRGQNVSLMGSIINPVNPNAKSPDYVHFSGWSRLNNSRWGLRYSQGRSFGNDSAVCYIYEPAELGAGSIFTYTIYLTTEDVAWYNSFAQQPEQRTSQQQNILIPAFPAQTAQPIQNPWTDSPSPTINIAAIEQDARNEAARTNGNANALVLIRLRELLDLFIAGERELNEQDLIEIENYLNRHR